MRFSSRASLSDVRHANATPAHSAPLHQAELSRLQEVSVQRSPRRSRELAEQHVLRVSSCALICAFIKGLLDRNCGASHELFILLLMPGQMPSFWMTDNAVLLVAYFIAMNVQL